MNDSIGSNLKELLEQMDLCSWLKLFSRTTWSKIEFGRKHGIKVYETSITQDLLFYFRLFEKPIEMPIQIFEAISERTNGNDLEIFIETIGGYLFFPTQAKIIYKNNKYSSLKHAVNGIRQIELLLEYATLKKGIPLYLFYNHCYDTEAIEQKIDFDIDLYGCSLVPASVIKQQHLKIKNGVSSFINIPSFNDLHPQYASPIHILGCDGLTKDSLEFLSPLAPKNQKFHFYTYQELLDDKNWKALIPASRIGRLNPDREIFGEEAVQATKDPSFSPRFRLILSRNKKGGSRLSFVS